MIRIRKYIPANNLVDINIGKIILVHRMNNSKYERVEHELSQKKESSMKVFGNSMTPIIKSGALITFKKFDTYEVGDVVFCKVKGRYIDAHKITRKSDKGYLISNNHGFDNGWTKKIFGKAIKIEN